MKELLYRIAVTLLPGVGAVRARSLLTHFPDVEEFFSASPAQLERLPGFNEQLVSRTIRKKALEQARRETEFVEKHHIRTLWFLDDDYPSRLRHCNDAPILLYLKGEVSFESRKVLSIVGTRHATAYGIDRCNAIVAELAENHPELLIVSGLAYGIDICAHRVALQHGLSTVAVLGHGLHMIYPAAHRTTAREIIAQGGLLTEYSTQHTPDKKNFIARNRIIAGLADATLVVESGEKGGALITADLASSYHREVFALPGRATDERSRGCNRLIKTNQAALIENAADLAYFLGWESPSQGPQTIQPSLFPELSTEEQLLLDILKEQNELPLDELAALAALPVSKTSALLLNLELAGLVRNLPGNLYKALG